MVERYNDAGIAAAAEEYFAENVEFNEPPEQPGARSVVGRDQTVRFFGEFDETWESHRSEPEEIRVLDDDRVLYLSIEHLRGRDGLEVSQTAASIFTVRDGRISAWQGFWSREDALKAAGQSG